MCANGYRNRPRGRVERLESCRAASASGVPVNRTAVISS
ncbi:hypothetical protein BTH_II0432 [Burkholderia thailandensis E264]|uniref:Uncharacterized protein n=1 Tax=Burkholderia thailandensis (strain ATCC 700388 / DSM 13276 / CCUG 48851 / CIP 106301 / E264) TaxID=271848 RepID=Q2T867_BURTA|nr:hypothetical protein BTH_II0432 [Burkholderia thailandensis E264]